MLEFRQLLCRMPFATTESDLQVKYNTNEIGDGLDNLKIW